MKLRQVISLFIACICLAMGFALIIAGERNNSIDNKNYQREQATLRSSFDVFNDPAASERLDNQQLETDQQKKLEAIALLSIPRLALDVVAVSFSKYDDLKTAIGYMPETAAPGEQGITYFVGHRTGFGAPFRDLDDLESGDQMTVVSAAGISSNYIVEFVLVKNPTQDIPELTQLSGKSNLLLVTCHPEFSTELRLVVGARGA